VNGWVIASWPSPQGDEYALAFDRSRTARLLVLSPLFDEANKTRHFIVEVMRRLDNAGIDCFLPDLPGCNESLAPLESQTLMGWLQAAAAAAKHFGATHVLAMRGGALVAPPLPGWRYAAQSGPSLMRALLRARMIASREAGTEETTEQLLAMARQNGIELAGYRLGPTLINEIMAVHLPDRLTEIAQADVGGGGLWLRAEPAFDAAQADALTAIIAKGLQA